MQLGDLVEAGFLVAGQRLVWRRPKLGVEYRAQVGDAGTIKLEDGREFSSPSRAAIEAAQIPAYDGWYAWRSESPDGESLHDLRVKLTQAATNGDTLPGA